ncbi:MAG: tetratricopeptide repeat protein [Bacteroidota bacterium]|jgi:hypothetical protein
MVLVFNKIDKAPKLLMIKMFFLKIAFIFALTSFANAQQTTHTADFKKGMRLMDSLSNQSDVKKALLSFENAILKEPQNWLSYYYAGICNVIISFDKKDKEIDFYCDKAEKYVNKADSISNNNSEIYVLKSMIAAARINVDAKVRSSKYGSMSTKYNVKALNLDPDNPRALLQKARIILNTPSVFGGGQKKAKPIFELALEKYKTFKPQSIYHPTWGRKDVLEELRKLKTIK